MLLRRLACVSLMRGVQRCAALRSGAASRLAYRRLLRAASAASSSSAAASFAPSLDSVRRNADPAAVFVVTGASRGIGAEFCVQLLARTRGTVVACCRAPESALPEVHDVRLRRVRLDVRCDTSIAALRDALGDRVDLLLNAAGVLHEPGQAPERALADVDRQWLQNSFDVNCAGAVLVSQALAPAMRRRAVRPLDEDAGGAARSSQLPTSVVANLSARVGSISDNRLGGWYSYRISKAALNMATKTMALELKRQRTIVVALHPGTTDTDLSKPFQKNVKNDKLFPVDFTATQLLDIVDGLTLDHTGGFFAWDGQPIDF